MTKLDMIKNPKTNENIIGTKYHKLFNDSEILVKREKFAQKVNINCEDVFAIVNYRGTSEDRNPYKEFINLTLLRKCLQSIEINLLKNKFIKLIDQNNIYITTLMGPNLELNLEEFYENYVKIKINNLFKKGLNNCHTKGEEFN